MIQAIQTPTARKGLRRALHVSTCWLAIVALIAGPVTPALAEGVVAAQGYGTRVTADQGVTGVLGQLHNKNDVAVFDRFTVAGGETVRLDMNAGAERMINIMRGADGVEIHGEVFSQRPDADVFFVTPGGFVLGAGGKISTGALTVSTAAGFFRDELLAEVRGGPDLGRMSELLAGREALNPAAEIQILGEIAARQLSLRAGKRLVLNGNVTISGTGTGGYQAPAVNSGDIERASGVQMRNGVVSLVSGGKIEMGGSLKVTNQSGSAAVTAKANDIHVGMDRANTSLVVGARGDAAAEASYVVMLAKNSVTFEKGVSVEVTGSPGAPAGLWLRGKTVSMGAVGTTTDPLALKPVSGEGSRPGSLDVTLEASDSLTLGAIRTQGGDITASAPHVTAVGRVETQGGNLLMHGREILVSNAQLDLTQTGAAPPQNGLLAIVAEADNSTFAWPITSLSDTKAKVEIYGSTLIAGAMAITATAKGGNRYADGMVQTLEEEIARIKGMLGEDGVGQMSMLEEAMEALAEGIANGMLTGAEKILSMIPVQVPVHATDAKILIADSRLETRGDARTGLPMRRLSEGTEAERKSRQAMHGGGLLQDGWGFRTAKGAKELLLSLPSDWQLDHAEGQAMADLYIRAHAETDVSISAGFLIPTAIGVGVAVMNTNSELRITGDSRLLSERDLTLLSTAKDSFTGSVSPGALMNVGIGVLVAKQSLKNRLLIDVTQIKAKRDITTAALTNRAHAATVSANAGVQGTFGLAVNVGVVESRTEAAVNARLDPRAPETSGMVAGGGIRLLAETRYYANDRSTSASMGYSNPLIAAAMGLDSVKNLTAKVTKFAKKLFFGINDDGGSEPSKPEKTSMGIGIALDGNWFDDTTFASLGGAYTDPVTGKQQLFANGAFTAGGVLQVKSGLDHAGTGALPGPKRGVSASLGTMDKILRQMIDAAQVVNPNISETDVLGEHDKAIMVAGGLTMLMGDSKVDLGGSLRGATVDATAFRDYGSPKGQLERFLEARKLLDGTIEAQSARDPLDPSDTAEPYYPSMSELTDLLYGYPITGSASAAGARSTLVIDGKPREAQGLAIGASFDGFLTSHDVTVTIRDGARVVSSGALSLNAYEDGVFIFGNNLPVAMLPPDSPFSGDARDVIGVTAHVHVARGRVGIDIGAAALSGQTIDAHARSGLSTGGLMYTGGGASDFGLNLSAGANVLLKQTGITASGTAVLTTTGGTGRIKLFAEDDSVVFLNAAALTGSEATAVGGAVVVNFDGRKVDAHVADVAQGAEAGRVEAGSFELSALNRTRGVTGAVAAAVASDPADPASSKASRNSGPGIFDDLLSQDLADALAGLEDLDINEGAEADSPQKKTGLALAGAAALNLSVGHHAKVSLGQGFAVTTSGDATLRAEDRSALIGITGALSLATGSDADSKAMGGSLNVLQGSRSVTTEMRGAMTSTAGAVTVEAIDRGFGLNIAVGGAGARNGSVALAGSVALNILQGEVTTKVFGTLSAAARLKITAEDRATMIALGGATAVSGATDGKGAGLGAASSTYDRDTLVEIGAGSRLSAGSLLVSAEFAARLWGFAGSFVHADNAGSGGITVNTVTSSAKVKLAGTAAAKIALTLSGEGAIRAKDDAKIYALGGAVGIAGDRAIGFGTAVNTIVNTTDLTLEHLTAAGRGSAALTSSVEAQSRILALAAAGGISHGDLAAAAGITVNTIRSSAALTARGSSFDDFARTDFTGHSTRRIESLAGGVAISAKTAAGAALAVNTITANDTKITLKNTSFKRGAVRVDAVSDGRIDTIAVAVGGSNQLAIGGSVAVNVISGTTSADILGGRVENATEVVQNASDTQHINALAGNGAIGLSGAGFGVATATNFIAQQTRALGSYDLTGTQATRLALSADNAARIRGAAATVAGGEKLGIGGSAVVGDIRNGAHAAYTGAAVRAGDITIRAKNDSTIQLLSGAAAFGGDSGGIGAAITVAQILDTTRAELISTKLATAGEVAVTADKSGIIETLAVSGGAGGQFGIGGSVVYTQIGRKSGVTGLTEAVPTEDGSSPTGVAIAEGEAQFDGLIAGLQGHTAAAGSDGLQERLSKGRASGEAHDVTEALVSLGGGGSFSALRVTARDAAEMSVMAGALAGGGAAGVGAAVAVNLNFSGTQAQMRLGSGEIRSALIDVSAYQTGKIGNAVAAGAGSGTFGGAAGIAINAMQRKLKAELLGQPNTLLQGANGTLILRAHQTGEIENQAVTAAGAGEVAIGATVAVNHLDDALTARIENVTFDAGSQAFETAGGVLLEAISRQTVLAAANAISGSSAAAVSGSVVVNNAGGTVDLITRDATFISRSLRAEARADRDISAYGGVASFSSVGVGLATAVNKSTATVTQRHDGLVARTGGNITLLSGADTSFGGAVAGLAGGGVAINGTAVANTTTARVTTRIGNGTRASDLAARGSLSVESKAVSHAALLSGGDEKPGANATISVGASVGAGASVLVNKFRSTVKTEIDDRSQLSGLGHATFGPEETGRGVRITAISRSTADSANMNFGVGASLGVAVLSSTTSMSDKAEVRLGKLADTAPLRAGLAINGALAANAAAILGTEAAHGEQEAQIKALSVANVEVSNLALGGGQLGAGGAITVTTFDNQARIFASGAAITAEHGAVLDALAEQRMTGWTLGLGGGAGALAGSLEWRYFNGLAEISLAGTDVLTRSAAGRIDLSAKIDTLSHGGPTAGAGAVIGAAGTLLRSVVDNEARITLQDAERALEPGEEAADALLAAHLTGGGAVLVRAETLLDVATGSQSGMGGGFALGLSMSLLDVASKSLVDLGGGSRIAAGGDLDIEALQSLKTRSSAGNLSASIVGLGGAVDNQIFTSRTAITVGAGVGLSAEAALRLTARAERDLQSHVMSGQVGGVAVPIARSRIQLSGSGAAAKDQDEAEASARADAALSAQNMAGGTGKGSGSALTAKLGESEAQGALLSDLEALQKRGPGKEDRVAVTLGAGAQVLGGSELAVSALTRTEIDQKATATAPFSGIAIAPGKTVIDVASASGIVVGDGVTLAARDRIALTAGEHSLREGLVSRAETVAGGMALAVGTGSARIDLRGEARVALGAGISLRHRDQALAGGPSVHLSAERGLDAQAVVPDNVSASLLVGGGQATARVTDSGTAEITAGRFGAARGSITASSLQLAVSTRGHLQATANASSAGALGGGAGADARVTKTSTSRLDLTGLDIEATGRAEILNHDASQISAFAKGAALGGGIAAGVSLAEAQLGATLLTRLAEVSLTAGRISLDTALSGAARAEALSSGGGIGSGAGAHPKAIADYRVETLLGARLRALSGDLTVQSRAEELELWAHASGWSAGGLGGGSSIATIGQSAKGEGLVSTRLSAWQTDAEDALPQFSATGTLRIASVNAPTYEAKAEAGVVNLAGGLGAETKINANLRTETVLVDGVLPLTLTGGRLAITADTKPRLAASLDTTSVTVAGYGGADDVKTVAISNQVTIGRGASLMATNGLDVIATLGVSINELDGDGADVVAGGYGGVNIAAGDVKTTITPHNGVAIADGAALIQLGTEAMRIAAVNRFELKTRMDYRTRGLGGFPRTAMNFDIDRSSALVTIGDAALVSGGDLRVSAGSDLDVRVISLVNAAAAVAAPGTRIDVTYDANNHVLVAAGASLEAERDILLLAGHDLEGAQRVAISAEGRVVNNSAIPVISAPHVKVEANDLSYVNLAKGASARAVRDIEIAAEGGTRALHAYSESKDLYRAVAEAIGNFAGGFFGGGPVSLASKGGTAEDRPYGIVDVSGAAVAGKNSIQRLRFDADNRLIAEDDADHQARTDWKVITGSGSTSTMETRQRQLKEWIANPAFAGNAAALVAWRSELSRLETVIAQARADAGKAQIVVGDVSASAGSVALRGNDFRGTGRISASGGAMIEISTASDAILEVGDVTLDVHNGGIVSFNGIQVQDIAHARRVLGSQALLLDTTIERSDTGAQEPKISISASRSGGILMQVGDILNLGGEVSLSAGRILAYGKQHAQALRIDASEDVSFEYEPGMRHTSGIAPETLYAEAMKRKEFEVLAKLTGSAPSDRFDWRAGSSDPEFRPVTDIDAPTISAATGIFIAADAVNVNSYIRAGISSYDINVDARLDAVLATITGTKPVLLWDPTDDVRHAAVTDEMIQSNARISYDPTTRRLLVDDLVATAGNIEITGDIFSTGGGRLEVLDGYGQLKLASLSAADIELGRVIIGGTLGADGTPIATRGRIVLNDVDHGEPGGKVTTRIFTRESASDPRQLSYQTKLGRDYIRTSALETQERWKTHLRQTVIAGYEVSKDSKTTYTQMTQPVVTPLGDAPYLAAALEGARYNYAIEGQVSSRHSEQTAKTMIKNKTVLGTGWREYEWQETKQTVVTLLHRFRADHAIEIGFSGQEAAAGQTLMDVNAKGSVIFGGQVTNFGGASRVVSQGGSIEAGNSLVTLGLGQTDLQALRGGIGQTEGGLRLEQGGGASLSARALTGIALQAPRGGLSLGEIAVTDGEARLSARDALTQVAGGTLSARDVTLQSQSGAIGSSARGLEIRTAAGGRLRAEAQGDIHIRESGGDLNIDLVRSSAGSVRLAARGLLLDANSARQDDLRSEDDVAALWDGDIGATSRDSAGFRSLVAHHEAEQERLYARYWDAREASGETLPKFRFSAVERATLREGGLSNAAITKMETERSAVWAGLSTETSRREDYSYRASAAEIDALAAEHLVDRDALRRSLSAQLVRERSSSTVDNHAPNVVAHGDIVLSGAEGVGADLPTRYIDMTQHVSDADLKVLNEALTTDLDFARPGFVGVKRHDDLTISQTGLDAAGRPLGAIEVSTAGNVHLATPGAALLRKIEAAGAVTLRAGGSIEGLAAGLGAGSLVQSGGDLILEAGAGRIGAADRALQVMVGAGGLVNLRARDGITLATEGSLILAEVYSPGRVQLTARDAISDAYDTGAARIVAGEIALTAAQIGDPVRGLLVRLLSDEEVAPYRDLLQTGMRGISLRATSGDLTLRIEGDATLLEVDVADDARIEASADLTLGGALRIADDLHLSVAGALDGAGAVSAQDLVLVADQIGSAGQALSLSQSAGGTLSVLSSGASHLSLNGDADLTGFTSFGGGSLSTEGTIRLRGADTLRFGGALSLNAGALDLTAASGTHVTGDLLTLTLASALGSPAAPLRSALAAFDSHGGHPIALEEADGLVLLSSDWLANGSVLRIGGALALQSGSSAGAHRLERSIAPAHAGPEWRRSFLGSDPVLWEEFEQSRKRVPLILGSLAAPD